MTFKSIYFIILLTVTSTVIAQVDLYIESDQTSRLDNVAVLIDNNYSFQEILNNPELEFEEKTKVPVKDITHYWIKCKIATSFAYDKTFSVWTSPMFDSELFSFNEESKKWESNRGGKLIASPSVLKYVTCIFKANEPTTFYVKINVKEINQYDNELKTTVYFQDETIAKANRKKDYDWWIITVAIVLAFLVYNLYWYVLIREKVYLYYLMIPLNPQTNCQQNKVKHCVKEYYTML